MVKRWEWHYDGMWTFGDEKGTEIRTTSDDWVLAADYDALAAELYDWKGTCTGLQANWDVAKDRIAKLEAAQQGNYWLEYNQAKERAEDAQARVERLEAALRKVDAYWHPHYSDLEPNAGVHWEAPPHMIYVQKLKDEPKGGGMVKRYAFLDTSPYGQDEMQDDPDGHTQPHFVLASDYDALKDSYQRLVAESAEQMSLYVAVYRRAEALEAALERLRGLLRSWLKYHGSTDDLSAETRAALAPESPKGG
jgi:hypothetical protein